MNTERYTDKVKQILQAAQSDALLRGHTQLTPWHILAQALADRAGLAENLLSAAGGDAAQLRNECDTALSKLATQQGGATQLTLATETAKCFALAERYADQGGGRFCDARAFARRHG